MTSAWPSLRLQGPRRPGRDRFRAHRGLMLAASGGAMAEAVVVLVTAPAARSLAPEVTALGPLAVFHDLRWLDSYGGSWAGFCAAVLVVLAARTAAGTLLARLAWPRGLDPPRLPVLLASAGAATLLTAVLLSPIATLAFGVAILPFSWPLLGALPVLLLVASLLSHAGVVPWWWRVLPPARAVAWLLADFLALSAAAAVTGWLPGWWAVPVAGLAGLLNARAWYGVTAALALRQPEPGRGVLARRATAGLQSAPEPAVQPPAPQPPAPRSPARPVSRRVPVAPLAAVLAVALVIGVARLTFAAAGGGDRASAASLEASIGARHAQARHVPRPARAPEPARSRPPVLDIEGFGSSCCSSPGSLRALAAGGSIRQFSYRGLSAGGKPLPYGRSASDLPLTELGNRIAAQVRRLHAATGKPVDLVAESEGTLGIYAMLARHPHVPVGSIALLSPILAPGQVSYPAGNGSGQGMVPGDELRAVVSFIASLSPYSQSGAQALIGSVNRSGARDARATAALARRRTFRWLVVVPLADALTLPACALPPGAVVVPALHGSLAGDPQVQRIVRRFLAGRPVHGRPGLRDAARTIAAAASAWRMPEPGTQSPSCPLSAAARP